MDINKFIRNLTVSALILASVACLPACSDDETAEPSETFSAAVTEEEEKTTETEETTEAITETTTEEINNYGYCGDDAVWKYDEASKTLTVEGTGIIKETYDIPYKEQVEKLIIREGITAVGGSSFSRYPNLKEVEIADSVMEISYSAFNEVPLYDDPDNWIDGILYFDGYIIKADQKLSGDIVLREGTRGIAEKAFVECANITSIILPDTVKCIGACAFGQCTGLEKLSIGKGLKFISEFAFEDPYATHDYIPCEALKTISVDSENPYFCDENGVLYNKEKTELIKVPTLCSQKKFVVPERVTSVNRFAFNYCRSLEKITFKNSGITNLEEIYFSGCDNLETVVLPENLEVLSEQAFKFSGIRYIVIPDEVKEIRMETFAYCDNLKSVTLGASISEISESAFSTCFMLEEINVASGNQYFSSKDGVLFNKDKTVLIAYPYAKDAEQYSIPDSVETIGFGAFDRTKNLKKLYIGKNVKTVESYNEFIGEIKVNEYYESVYEGTYDIYYKGTQAQWEQINSSNEDFDDIRSTVHFNA